MARAEVIGDPIAHSLSPAIHLYWLDALELEGRFEATLVRSGDLAGFIAERRSDPDWRGCSVTAPHKLAVRAHVDFVSEIARQADAVNCVVREGGVLHGLNTDVDGVREAISGIELVGRKVVLIGAGGAARAALACLAARQAGEIVLLVRSPARVAGLPGRALPFEQAAEAFDGASLAINATPMGMDHQPEIPPQIGQALAGMAAGASLLDMVYRPLETPLLRAARERGLGTVDGLAMLIGQAREAFRRFFRAEPPRDRDAELRALLAHLASTVDAAARDDLGSPR